MKNRLFISFNLLINLLLILAVILLVLTTFKFNYFAISKVMSGSMEPNLQVGSLVFSHKIDPNILKVGDVVTFYPSQSQKLTITHRISQIIEGDNSRKFFTKGDANENVDSEAIYPHQITGQVLFTIPMLGFISSWMRTPIGFLLMIILPAVFLIIIEISNIKKAVEEDILKKYSLKSEQNHYFYQNQPVKLTNKPYQKLYLKILIIFFLSIPLPFLVTADPIGAFFRKSVSSASNLFIADSQFPSTSGPSGPSGESGVSGESGPSGPSGSSGPSGASQMLINEVFESGDNNSEWIELFNPTSQEIDISGWKIGDADSSDSLPSISPIPVGSYVVITASDVITVPSSAIKLNLNSYLGSGLNGTGDLVVLRDAGNNLIDQMSYGNNSSAFPSPPAYPGTDQSLVRIPNGSDTDTTVDWQLDSNPTIGEVNNL